MLVILGVDSLIIRPIYIIGGWNDFIAPHQLYDVTEVHTHTLIHLSWIS